MSLPDAVFTALTGRTERHSHDLDKLIQLTEAVAGGPTHAARYVGVGYSTWKRWKAGQVANPRATSWSRLWTAEDQARMPNAERERLRREGFTLTAVRTDAHTTRSILAKEGSSSGLRLLPGTIDAVLAAYDDGDDVGMAERLCEGIGDDWYASHLSPYTDDGVDDNDRDYAAMAF